MATIFLDLDGTLTDPKIGITQSVIYALQNLGLPAPEMDELEWVIGPALVDSFTTLGAEDPQRALALYRERYTETGLFENSVYPGIPEVLENLTGAGHQLCLATAKPHAYARRITAHFGLAPYLSHEFGPELDGTRNNKADLLEYALQVIGQTADTCIMIGDRHHDIDAARANKMASIGVSWGYGNPQELAPATRKCETPGELPGAVTDILRDMS